VKFVFVYLRLSEMLSMGVTNPIHWILASAFPLTRI